MKSLASFFLLALLLVACSLSIATHPDPDPDPEQSARGKPTNQNSNAGGNDGGFFGSGFGIPGYDSGWGNMGGGYGGGYGGPKGGHSQHGVMRSSVVCKERGRCYKKKLTCPAKCYTSYSRSGKGFGGGGGGGGCTLDCNGTVPFQSGLVQAIHMKTFSVKAIFTIEPERVTWEANKIITQSKPRGSKF
uniref:Expansin-like EG45 domain-containing protein n=1 Tax=Salix viminalis TaxID=40686 RepID=A0A6N2L1P9_SALVM